MRFPSTTRRDGPSVRYELRAGNLHMRACLSGQRLGNVIWGRRKRAKLWMHLGEIVEAGCEASQPAGLGEAGERLIDRVPSPEVKEIVGREYATAPGAAGSLYDSRWDR